MNLGYACINTTLGKQGNFRTMTVKKASSMSEQDRLREIMSRTRTNIDNLATIMQWNVDNNIHVYRVSSDLIPLATHEINNYNWQEDDYILDSMDYIKKLAEANNIRISVHPSQFCVISTERESVLQNTIKQLKHEALVSLHLGINDMCIHVGSSKPELFIKNFNQLPQSVKSLIRLENDDKCNNVDTVLSICEELNIPMILDFHHDRVLNGKSKVQSYISRIKQTWNNRRPICHISSPKGWNDVISAHDDYVSIKDYNMWKQWLVDFDVEVEAKAKELAVFYLM